MNKLVPKPATRKYAVILISLALAASACWFFFSCSTTNKEVRNVILISMDTCRADHLSCYGYPEQTTPNIDMLARESILFTNAYTTDPITLPAHSSMLTGTIPPHHGVLDNIDYKLGRSNLTLAEILSSHKFTASAVVSSCVLDSKFGLNQGFNFYDDHLGKIDGVLRNQRTGEEVNHAAFKWLDRHKDERFFLFLHYYDPHHPYQPPEPFASRYPENLYAGEIAYTDYCIGQVIARLKKLGLYDSALIIITSDHGEMRGEHGENSHCYFIYQSVLKVPLIFKLPGHDRGLIIDDPVSLVDIVPTVCSQLNIQTPSNIQGKDLCPYFSGKQESSPERYLYCESFFPTRYNLNSLLGVVTNGWKYIQTTRPELYDLSSDPGETKNLIKKHPNRARILKDRLKHILEDSVRKGNIDNKTTMSREEKNRLESLGYLASNNINEGFNFDQTMPDPKDFIDFHRQNSIGIARINNNQLLEAKLLYNNMLKYYQQSPEIHYRLAEISSKQNKLDEAVKHLKIAIKIRPDSATMQFCLGRLLYGQNKLDEAMIHFNNVLKINPNWATAHNNMGKISSLQGKIKKAIHHFTEAIRIDPYDATSHEDLGEIMKQQGEIKEAIVHYSTAIKLDPNLKEAQISLGEAHFTMGNLFVGKNESKEAIDHFKKSLQLNHNFAKAHMNLGYALLAQGKEDEAKKHCLEAIHIDPENSINAYYNLACIYAKGNHIDESTDWLKIAIDKGFNDWNTLKTDNDLENIRKSKFYAELMETTARGQISPGNKE